MLIVDFYKIPAFVSLGVVVAILTTSIVMSLMYPFGTRREGAGLAAGEEPGVESTKR
jgi:hypothetical protein